MVQALRGVTAACEALEELGCTRLCLHSLAKVRAVLSQDMTNGFLRVPSWLLSFV